jgi:hypothetical protein
MLKDADRYEHEKFKRLCALAASSSLAPFEISELEEHLHRCADCREALSQYRVLSAYGMGALADGYVENPGSSPWDTSAARNELLLRVENDRKSAVARKELPVAVPNGAATWKRSATRIAAWGALAAGLLLAVGFGAYRLGTRRSTANPAAVAANSVVSTTARPSDQPAAALSAEKTFTDRSLADQSQRVAQLEAASAAKEQELGKVRAALAALETRSAELANATAQTQAESQSLSQQRDALTAQLQAMTQAYESQRTELASLRAERDKTVVHTATLETRIAELSAANSDQERRLKDAEQYLNSDRDIRELMGARKLYIADVFDVDGSSRTQRPFGRVFYTQGKSLIFYAFDLDREPGVINASTFQVWGQRETPQGEQAAPMNLGILYKDNDTNRRWVMRFDESKELSEIDAVFVTVEPRGGSHKPTTKPFLYALLRNEANHP